MGTEQDVKEAFSDRPGESEVLAHLSAPQAQLVVDTHPTTVLTAHPAPMRPLTNIYGTTPQRAGPTYAAPADVKTVQLFAQPMVASPGSTSSSSTQARYIYTTQEEDMDVAQSLTELSKVKVIQPYHASQSSRLLVISRGENGEIEIVQDQNVSLDKGEEKLLKKIAKTASVRPLKSDKEAAYASLDMEISQYLIKYEDEEAAKKITMRDLRHVIPLLIMRCYAVSDEPYQRKVRGMWTDRPENWPTDIPYCDPNNKKDSGKPKKNTLLQMFIYLKGVYTSNHSDVLDRYKSRRSAAALAPPPPPVPSALSPPAMEDMETVTTSTAAMPAGGVPSTALEHPYHPAMSRGVPGTPPRALPDHTPPSVLRPHPHHTHPQQQAGPPQQTVHVASFSELDQDWDPEGEIVKRIEKKMKIVEVYDQLTDLERTTVRLIRDVIFNMFQVRSQDHLFFLEIAHEFEASLDVIKITGALPEKSLNRWKDFYEKNHEIPDVAASEQVLDIAEDTVACEPLGLGREEEVITDNNIVVSTEDNIHVTKASSGSVGEPPESPALYLQAFSQELEQSEHTAYLSPDLQQAPLNADEVFETVTIEPQGSPMIKRSGSVEDESERKESVNSELASLLKSSLQMTGDMHYAQPLGKPFTSPSQAPPPHLSQAPPSCNLSQAPQSFTLFQVPYFAQGLPSSISQAPASTFSQAPASAISQAPASTFSQAPASAISQAPASIFSQAPTSAIIQAPTSAISQAPTSATSQAPTPSYHSQVPPSSCLSAPPLDNLDFLPDAHDKAVFPLSADADDILDNESWYSIIMEPVDPPPSAPSTKMVSTVVTAQSSATIIQQEQSRGHTVLEKIKAKTEGRNDKTENIKTMAQAFHHFQKQNMQFQGVSCQPVNPAYSSIIPVVVEDMEKEVPGEPNCKKRKMLKRRCPNSEITIG